MQEQPTVYNLRNGPQLYEDYVKKFGKKFRDSQEYHERYYNFMETLRKVNEINSQPNTQKVRLNQYADLSETAKLDLMEQTTKIDIDLKLQMQNSQKISVDSMFNLIDMK